MRLSVSLTAHRSPGFRTHKEMFDQGSDIYDCNTMSLQMHMTVSSTRFCNRRWSGSSVLFLVSLSSIGMIRKILVRVFGALIITGLPRNVAPKSHLLKRSRYLDVHKPNRRKQNEKVPIFCLFCFVSRVAEIRAARPQSGFP